MPSDNVELRVPCGVRDLSRECPACQSPQVVVAFSTVAADYLTCKTCDHTWSVARMAASFAYRISKIIGVLRSIRS